MRTQSCDLAAKTCSAKFLPYFAESSYDCGGRWSGRTCIQSGVKAVPQFDPELIQIMKSALEDIMMRVPLESATPAAKAYLAECILKAAAQGQTNYDALLAAAADQLQAVMSLLA
jgi:hypothetical protein